jgi:hypothetical protein
MSLFPLAQDHYLLEPYGVGMLQAKDPQSIELTGQEPCAPAKRGGRNHEDQDALADDPTATVFKERQFHVFIAVRPYFSVVTIQVKQRAALRRHAALKGASMHTTVAT